MVVAVLALHSVKVDAAAMHTAGRSRLEPAHPQSQLLEIFSQGTAGQCRIGTALIGDLSHVNSAVQIRSGGDDHCRDGILCAQGCDHTGDSVVFGLDLSDLRLFDLQEWRFFADLFHVVVIADTVCLHPKAVDSRTFAPVQHPALEKAGVCRLSHFAAQCVDLPDEMAFCRAADGRIAGHIGDLVERNGKQHRAAAQTGRGKGSLHAGMACADHGDIISSHVIIFHRYHLSFI